MRKNFRYFAFTSLVALSISDAAWAQSNPAQPGPGVAASGSVASPVANDAIDDIVVTAQRRSERLQDVPIAVSAFTGDTLTEKHIGSPLELTKLVPSLTYTHSSGNEQPFLRGIGTTVTSVNVDAGVATYLDGIYASNMQGQLNTLLGVERIEVVVGPQGTLYGRNAVGGAINVISLTPTQDFDAEALVTYGNYNHFEGAAHISGPLSDNLSAGIYVGGSRRDSYYKSGIPENARTLAGTPDHESQWGIRGKLVFDNHNGVRVVASGEYTNQISKDLDVFQNTSANATGVVAFGAPLTLEPFHDVTNGPALNRNNTTMLRLEGQFDLGFAHLVSLSSYREVNVRVYIDADGTSAPLTDVGGIFHTKTYTQEFQLQSQPSSKIKWIIGAYGFHELGSVTPSEVISGVIFAPNFGAGTYSNVDLGYVRTNNWAVFSQATIPFGERLNLTVGGRYSHDYKRFDATTYFQQILNATDRGTPFGTTTYPTRNADWGSFTPKVTLDYKVDDTLLYATYSKGFKAGAWNIQSPAAQSTPISPEKLDAYEIGTKSDFLGHRIRFNTAAFYYSYKNIQTRTIDFSHGSVTTFQNAASAKTYGAEAYMSAKLGSGFELNIAGAALHTEYTSFPNLSGYVPAPVGFKAATINATGNQLPRSPKFVLNTD